MKCSCRGCGTAPARPGRCTPPRRDVGCLSSSGWQATRRRGAGKRMLSASHWRSGCREGPRGPSRRVRQPGEGARSAADSVGFQAPADAAAPDSIQGGTGAAGGVARSAQGPTEDGEGSCAGKGQLQGLERAPTGGSSIRSGCERGVRLPWPGWRESSRQCWVSVGYGRFARCRSPLGLGYHQTGFGALGCAPPTPIAGCAL